MVTASDVARGGEGERFPRWRRYVAALLAAELSALCRYGDRVIEWLPRPARSGLLLAAIDARDKQVVRADEPFPDLAADDSGRPVVLLDGSLNHEPDVQGRLQQLRAKLPRVARVALVLYNPYLRGLYRLANRLGLRKGELPETFITRFDLQNFARLAGFEVVRQRSAVFVPWRLLGLGSFANRVLPVVPGLRWFGLTYVAILRPLAKFAGRPGVSCVVPARNERGNIEAALLRFPDLRCPTEILFVEGHSSDGTWEEIQRVLRTYTGEFSLVALRQNGEGKGDAVRLGFSRATQPLLVILDADLTVPPEALGRFYDAFLDGHGDFVNGSRLVYPMEGAAMRFLNRLGNVFFAKALSWLLDARLGDSLCGTKLLLRADYERIAAWRRDFGDFDPFGDFELLFPAAELGLGIVDMPVRYRARTYGATSIRRFRHGLQLLRMTWIGLFRLKLGKAVR